LPRLTFVRDHIAGNKCRSHVIRYIPDYDHWSQSSAVETKLRLTRHLSIVINCSVLHATWRGRWQQLHHQQTAVHCAGRSRGAWGIEHQRVSTFSVKQNPLQQFWLLTEPISF